MLDNTVKCELDTTDEWEYRHDCAYYYERDMRRITNEDYEDYLDELDEYLALIDELEAELDAAA
jgi:hypothetical protein